MNNIKPQIVKIAKNILSGSKAPAIELLMGNKYNQNETVRYGRITFTKSKYIILIIWPFIIFLKLRSMNQRTGACGWSDTTDTGWVAPDTREREWGGMRVVLCGSNRSIIRSNKNLLLLFSMFTLTLLEHKNDDHHDRPPVRVYLG